VVRTFVVFYFVCLVITIYAIVAICGLTGQSHSSVGTTLGFVTIATTTGMYASPMATIVRVIRTKTATSMPFTMGLVNVLNSFCWGVYGALVHNMFLLAPNIVEVSLSATQMVVTYIYRTKEPRNDLLISTSSEEHHDELNVVVVPSEQEEGDSRETPDSTKRQNFVAMRSPRPEDSDSWQELRRSGRQQRIEATKSISS
jgi:solute carrier family 50 protein (sugar transporter)